VDAHRLLRARGGSHHRGGRSAASVVGGVRPGRLRIARQARRPEGGDPRASRSSSGTPSDAASTADGLLAGRLWGDGGGLATRRTAHYGEVVSNLRRICGEPRGLIGMLLLGFGAAVSVVSLAGVSIDDPSSTTSSFVV
jgi:hypothetical protein